MKGYRREIDGLRAVAVLPVVLFHAGMDLFSGGYLGVDVFFVISGYLITGIILQEQKRGDFSIIRFYERRARRILPALSLVMLCSVPFALLWLIPAKMTDYSASLVSVAFFVSNIFFWSETGYFADRAEEQPMLHTWSLAVEEQYYILFPLLLILFWRINRERLGLGLLLLFAGSLLLAEHWSKTAPEAGFFLLPARAWELMGGAMLAYSEFRHGPVANSRRGAALSLLGIVLVLLCMLLFTDGTRHPSIYTLVPVAGTMLIIRYGRAPGLAFRLLTHPWMVGVGLVSYSLYLWHQPVFAFAHVRSLQEPTLVVMLPLALLSLLMAYLSWRYVERPFRVYRTGAFSRGRIFSYSGATIVLFTLLGLLGVQQQGFPGRFDPVTAPILTAFDGRNPTRELCFDKPLDFYFSSEHRRDCTVGQADKVRTIIWGDSHADALGWEVGQAIGREGEGLLQVTNAGCVPIPGVGTGKCARFNKKTFEQLKGDEFDTVVLHGRWTINIEGDRFDNQEGGAEPGRPDPADVRVKWPELEGLQGADKVMAYFTRRIEEYLAMGKNVILIYPIPEAGWQVPKYTLNSLLYGNDNRQVFDPNGGQFRLSTSYAVYKARNQRTVAMLDAISHPRLYRVRPEQVFCDSFLPGRCVNAFDGEVFYRDDDHLSDAGARLVAEKVVEQLRLIRSAEAGL